MINPQPVHTPRSPYSSGENASRPTILSEPTPGFSPTNNAPSPTPPTRTPRRWKRYVGITVLAVIFGVMAYGLHQYRALTKNIILDHEGDSAAILEFDPNDTKNFDASKFTKPGDGRFTMVLAGAGGENHPGGTLTDTIQVLSIDTVNDSLSFTSIPRDLFVNVPGYGRTKINTVYNIGEKKKTGGGALLLRDTVSSVLGTKVSNFALVDFTGIKQIVDALGGVEIDVPKAINDPYYPADDMLHYSPFSIKAGIQTLDGATALKYVRSRKTTSDFDRAERQQLVIAAIKKKALSVGVLTNPTKVNNLITALGKHFKTDIQVKDIRTLIDIYKDIPSEKSTGHVLDTSSQLGLLTSTTDPVAGYIAYPLDGYDKFEDIKQWFHKNNPDPLSKREGPTVTIYTTGKATQRQMTEFKTLLEDYGYTVTIATQPAPGKLTSTKIMAKSPDGKPVSRNYLVSLVGKSVEKGQIVNGTSTDFEIVYVPTATAANVKSSPTPKASPKASPSPSATP